MSAQKRGHRANGAPPHELALDKCNVFLRENASGDAKAEMACLSALICLYQSSPPELLDYLEAADFVDEAIGERWQILVDEIWNDWPVGDPIAFGRVIDETLRARKSRFLREQLKLVYRDATVGNSSSNNRFYYVGPVMKATTKRCPLIILDEAKVTFSNDRNLAEVFEQSSRQVDEIAASILNLSVSRERTISPRSCDAEESNIDCFWELRVPLSQTLSYMESCG